MTKLIIDTELDGIAILRLNAPERMNAISLEMREEVITALQRRFQDETRAIVLTGSGSNFSAGGDIKTARPEHAKVAGAVRHKLSRLHEMIRLIVSAPKPVVAAVEGKAYGAGMSLALACDAVVATETAQFSAAFGRVGLVPDAGLLYTLPRRVGGARAQHLLLTARTVKASEAMDIGLIDTLVSSHQLLDQACFEANRLGAIAPLTLAAIKSLGAAECMSLEQAFSEELRLQPLLSLTGDNAEARSAFAERRLPRFRGY